ncbi:MAG: hypothetical protein NVS3B7_14630 [Candidatus Elarobacter sp.]
MSVLDVTLTVERFWDLATRGELGDIEELLKKIPASRRVSDPLVLGLRGVSSILSGDVKSGAALLRRATDHVDSASRPYLIDILVPILVSLDDLDESQQLLQLIEGVDAPFGAAFLALRAVVAARRGFDDDSRDCAAQANALAPAIDDPMVAARTLQRVGLAAFYREDYEEAQERSLQAARAYERIDAYRAAAHAYSVLYAIGVGWLGDPDISRMYAERIATIAARGGDVSMHNLGLVAQLEIAAEAGDHLRFTSIRDRLLSNPMSEQYRERFGMILSEVIANGWVGRFELARRLLTQLQTRSQLSVAEAMLCDALLALFDAARWELPEARRRAHRVLSRTAARPEHEALWEALRRRTARIVAACVCIIVGETTRGKRALSRSFDPDGQFANIDIVRGIDEDMVPPMMRGYARLINVAGALARENQPKIGLTRTETEVLKALPAAPSAAALAQDLGKSKRTIEAQLASIYTKMDVTNRSQAIDRARFLGIIA